MWNTFYKKIKNMKPKPSPQSKSDAISPKDESKVKDNAHDMTAKKRNVDNFFIGNVVERVVNKEHKIYVRTLAHNWKQPQTVYMLRCNDRYTAFERIYRILPTVDMVDKKIFQSYLDYINNFGCAHSEPTWTPENKN